MIDQRSHPAAIQPGAAGTSAPASDDTGVLVRRLARPHPSGGMVIERSVILAEGSRSRAILTWIAEHEGVADSSAAGVRSSGLHGPRPGADSAAHTGPARRFILPAHAFA